MGTGSGGKLRDGDKSPTREAVIQGGVAKDNTTALQHVKLKEVHRLIYNTLNMLKKILFLCIKVSQYEAIDLLTIKCTTLKRDQFSKHFLFFIEIAQQVYFCTKI